MTRYLVEFDSKMNMNAFELFLRKVVEKLGLDVKLIRFSKKEIT